MADVLLTVSGFIPDDIHEQIAQGKRPQADYLALAEGIPADLIDYRELQRSGSLVSRLAGWVFGNNVRLAVEVFRRRKNYRVLFTDGEQVGMPLALLLKWFGRGPQDARHMMIAHILSVGKKKVLFDFLRLQTHIDRFLVYSTNQAEFIRRRWQLPPEKVIWTPFQVDVEFFSPATADGATSEALIASAGLEYRDYPTLMQAVDGLELRTFLAAASPWSKRPDTTQERPIPKNVEVGRLSLDELRDLYARSDLVVVPLYPVEFQAGVTTLLEAMAMGKAVVVTRTKGQTDVVVDGETGVYVPPGNAAALRTAILDLLVSPEKRAKLGLAARQQMVQSMSLDKYVENMRRIAVELGSRPETLPQKGLRKKTLKVAFFSNSITFGGMEVYMITLANALRELDLPGTEIDVTIIIPEGEKLDGMVRRCAELGLPVMRLTLTGNQPVRKWFRTFVKLSSWLQENQIDIFHEHRTGPFHGKWAILAARLAGTPYVTATEHNAPLENPGLVGQSINSMIDRMLDKIFVVSEENRGRQIENGGRDAQKLVRVYPGFDFTQFVPLDEVARRQKREQLGVPVDAPLVGVAARLVKVKGVPTFLDAVAELRDRFPEIRALVVGDGKDRQKLRRQTQDLGLDSQVIFTGFRTDVSELIGSLDVFVLPSLYEPFGMVLVEALAMRVPVVATAVGGIPEIILDRQTGLLVPPGDSTAMAQAVTAFLEDSVFAQSCSERGRERSREFFNRSRMAKETYAVYADFNDRSSG